jgi:peptidoglycan biosynthesis protein MviN/MurJ (putative lipid II flippase)
VFYGITVTFLLAVGAETVLRILYAHGEFNIVDLSRTRDALLLMLTGFGGMCVYPLLMRVFQAERRFPALVASAASAMIYLALAPVLAVTLGTNGLALAFGIATSIPAAVSTWALARNERPPANLVRGWVIQATAIIAFILLHYAVLDPILRASFPLTIGVLGMEAIAYLVVLWLLRVPEARQAQRWIAGRLGRRSA